MRISDWSSDVCSSDLALKDEFDKLGVSVLGVSTDPVKKLARFIGKYDLKVDLASDEKGGFCEAFGTWIEKSMYGRTYMGIARAPFLIAGQDKFVRVWPKVKVAEIGRAPGRAKVSQYV